MSRILTQARSLVKGDVVLRDDKALGVRAVLPHPTIEDHVLVLFLAGCCPADLTLENGELVRIKERKRPIY